MDTDVLDITIDLADEFTVIFSVFKLSVLCWNAGITAGSRYFALIVK